jgi:hypothetical protein
MRKIIFTLVLMCLAQASFGCDEACKRAQAETTNNIKFASYLDTKYCKSTAQDFILRGSKSLKTYRDKQLATAHRGGAKNIRNFINQRIEWLQECDNYLKLTDQGRVFRDKETSEKILKGMDGVAEELKKMMLRPAVAGEDLEKVSAPAAAKFDQLFKMVDDHYLELQRRGLM